MGIVVEIFSWILYLVFGYDVKLVLFFKDFLQIRLLLSCTNDQSPKKCEHPHTSSHSVTHVQIQN